MAYTPLSERLGDLPLVICGPILRRVEANEVTVWVALKESRMVWLRVHEYTELSPPPNLHSRLTRVMDGGRETIRLGDHLHVVAVTAKLINEEVPLSSGKIYKYNLFFTDPNVENSSATVGLHNINLSLPGLTAPIDFTIHYDDEMPLTGPQPHANHNHLPSFSLAPDDLNKLRIIHGSCRKPNAEGLDAMPAIDDMLLSDNRDPLKRPHYLFLTGDQIYADDLSPILLYLLMEIESTLMGSVEELPLIGRPSLPDDQGENANLLPGKREEAFRKKGKYTSQDLHSHAGTAGEYFALYLLVWSDVLWDEELPSFEQVHPHDPTTTQIGSIPSVSKEYFNYDKDSKSLLKFKSTLKKVRRALANVPVYMMFDDHDVTDDWNMTYHWCEEVYGNILGKRLVMNGLLSYALFQDWGNKPGDYLDQQEEENNSNGQLLLQAVGNWFGSGSKRINSTQFTSDEENTLHKHLGLPALSTLSSPLQGYVVLQQDTQALDWHFHIRRTNYDVYFLDGRTRRGYPVPNSTRRGKKAHADIISEDSILKQFGPPPAAPKPVNFIVAPTPVISIPAIEIENLPILISWYPKGKLEKNVYEYDFFDHWRNQSRGSEKLLSFLSQRNRFFEGNTEEGSSVVPSKTVFLTGDVHFSAASRMLYHSEKHFLHGVQEEEERRDVFVQLVSSSFKKQTEETLTLHQMGYKFSNSYILGTMLEKAKVISPHIYLILLVLCGLVMMTAILVIHIFTSVILKNILDPKGQKPRHFLGWADPMAKENIDRLRIPTFSYISGLPEPKLKDIITTRPGVYEKTVLNDAIEPKLRFPDWQYRIDYIVAENDVREAAPYPTESLEAPGPGDRTEALKNYLTLAKHHRDYAQKWGNGKEIVGVNNVAEIFLDWNDTEENQEKFILQENWWRLQGKNDQILPLFPLTKYRVSLNIDDPAYTLPELPKPDNS